MKHCVFFIVMLLGLMSCGAQKTLVSQEVQTDSTVETYDSAKVTQQIDKLVKEAVNESLTRLINQTVDIDRVIYSAPDSTGSQYVVETQTIKVETQTKENRSLAVESDSHITKQVDSTYISASVEDLVVEMNTEIEEKTGLPWWQKSLMLLGAAVLALLIIRIALKFI